MHNRVRPASRLERPRLRGLPLWAQLLIPLALLIVLALAADAWVFQTGTGTTRAAILGQTLQDRPGHLRAALADEASTALEGARYLARVAGPTLAQSPPDLYALQHVTNDLYYRFSLDRYGFDLVATYDPQNQPMLAVSSDAQLNRAVLPEQWTAGLTATVTLVPLAGDLLLAGHAPIIQGGRYLGQVVVGTRINGAYLSRLKQMMNGPVLLALGGQIQTSFPRGPGVAGLPATVQTALSTAARGQTGTAIWDVDGRSYAAGYGPLDWAGTTGAFAVLEPTDNTDRLVNTGLRVSLETLGVTLLLVLVGALVFVATVTRPVTALVHTAGAIRAGALDRRARVTGQGEIGLLGRTFNAMADSLADLLSAERAQREHERARLTTQLGLAAGQLAHVATGQAEAARDQVGAVDRLTASIARGGQAVGAIAESAHAVEGAARATLKSAGDGEASSTDLAQALQRLDLAGASVSRELEQLLEVWGQVGGVLELLDDMSDTVRVLALNAAIEASAAGPHGVRFRVIATAIDELARRSNEEATGVRELMDAMRTAGDRALVSAGAGATEIQQTLPLMGRSKHANHEIATRARRDLELVEQITRAIEGLRGVGNESVRSVQNLDRLAGVAAQAALEVAAGADRLHILARDLEHTGEPAEAAPASPIAWPPEPGDPAWPGASPTPRPPEPDDPARPAAAQPSPEWTAAG